jgi:hypothetical protein
MTRHLVVQADNRHADERHSVVDSKDVFLVDVNMEELMERANVTNSPVIVSACSEAIEAGAAPR